MIYLANDNSNYLHHYGVLGMKWGHHKNRAVKKYVKLATKHTDNLDKFNKSIVPTSQGLQINRKYATKQQKYYNKLDKFVKKMKKKYVVNEKLNYEATKGEAYISIALTKNGKKHAMNVTKYYDPNVTGIAIGTKR